LKAAGLPTPRKKLKFDQDKGQLELLSGARHNDWRFTGGRFERFAGGARARRVEDG
jgi:hypothetical protein